MDKGEIEMLMRLVRWKDNPSKMAVLYSDGSIRRFDTETDAYVSPALTDILTRFKEAKDLKAVGSEEQWMSKHLTDMADWGDMEVDTAAYVTTDADDAKIVVLDSSIIRYWLTKETATATEDAKAEQSQYLTLDEYLAEVNSTRAPENQIRIGAVRSRVARHQLPGARKIGNFWMVPKGTPWPIDRRTQKSSREKLD